MTAICFPNTDLLKRTLLEAIIPTAITSTCVRFAPDADGGVWLDSDAPLPREVLTRLRRLGVQTKGQGGPTFTETLTCWDQALPLERFEQSGPILIELTEAKRLPHLMAELRRFHCVNLDWHVDDAGTAWVRVDDPPAATLFRAELVPSLRIYVEQSPQVWVQRGWRHPLPRPYQPPDGFRILMHPERAWRSISATTGHRGVDRFHVHAPTTHVENDQQFSKVVVKPRLAADRESGIAELWILSNEAKLFSWLRSADDRLVARLEVARVEVDGAARIALLSRGGRGGPPVLVLDADAFQSYLKLPNLFIPVGTKLVPPLRRDMAKRALVPGTDDIAWLDRRGLMTSVPISAFQPLQECVRYERPSVEADVPVVASPVVTLEPYDVKDRPAGERLKIVSDESQKNERWTMRWDRGQWRLLARRKP